MKKKLWIIILLVLLIAGCSKSESPRDIDSGYANEYEYSGINGPTDEEIAKNQLMKN